MRWRVDSEEHTTTERAFLASRGDAMKTTLSDEIIPAGGYWASVVPHGQILRIVDVEGNQGVDFL